MILWSRNVAMWILVIRRWAGNGRSAQIAAIADRVRNGSNRLRTDSLCETRGARLSQPAAGTKLMPCPLRDRIFIRAF